MMTWVEIALTILFAIFLATVAIALYYFGMFEEIVVKVGPSPFDFGKQTVAYKLARGPYNKAGHLFTKLTCDLVDIEPDPVKAETDLVTMGFYYDDVEMTTDDSKLRYAIGVILPQDNTKRKNALKVGLESRGYSFTTLPKIDHVVYSCFPFKSNISILIAIRRVYPIIRSFIAQHNLCAHPALEIYDKEYIHFILPLSKQDSFYLFESDDEDEEEEEDEESSSGHHGDDADSESSEESDGREVESTTTETGHASNSEAEYDDRVDPHSSRISRRKMRSKSPERELSVGRGVLDDDDDSFQKESIPTTTKNRSSSSKATNISINTNNQTISISRTSTSSFEDISVPTTTVTAASVSEQHDQ